MKSKRLSKSQKAKLEAQWDAEREQRLQAWERWVAAVKDKTFKASVRWFDKVSGEGWIEIAELGIGMPLYACNIAGKKTWYPGTACVFYEAKQEIDVKIDPFYSGSIALGLTQGTFDADKWNSLDQSRLAFKCNEQGEAINGFFAKGAGL